MMRYWIPGAWAIISVERGGRWCARGGSMRFEAWRKYSYMYV
eukprot:COSAG01_NODE_6281_length_3755_cov_5.597374_4_plen_42_part_00